MINLVYITVTSYKLRVLLIIIVYIKDFQFRFIAQNIFEYYYSVIYSLYSKLLRDVNTTCK